MHGVQQQSAHRFTHMVSQIQWCHHAARSTVVGRIGLIMRNINMRCAILHLTSQNSTSCFTSRDGVLGFASCNLQYAFNSYRCTISADLKKSLWSQTFLWSERSSFYLEGGFWWNLSGFGMFHSTQIRSALRWWVYHPSVWVYVILPWHNAGILEMSFTPATKQPMMLHPPQFKSSPLKSDRAPRGK